MEPRRHEIDPSDLSWGDSLNEHAKSAPADAVPAVVAAHPAAAEEHAAGHLEHAMDDTLRSLAQTRARCRHLSERALARALEPTAPAIPSLHGLRPPEVGPTDVVTLRPPPSAPPPRGHRS